MPEGGGERGTDTPDPNRWSEWIDAGGVLSCWRKREATTGRHLKSKQTVKPCQPFKPDYDETFSDGCIPVCTNTHTHIQWSGQHFKNTG